MAIVLDAHNSILDQAAAGTVVITLPSYSANALLFIAVYCNTPANPIVSVTDTQTLSWSKIGPPGTTGGSFPIEVWSAQATSAQASTQTITATFSGSGANAAFAWAITGHNIATPLDGTPTIIGGAGSTVGANTYTTTNNNCFVFAASRFSSQTGATAGAGWTLVNSTTGVSMAVEYQVPGTITTYTGDYTTGAGNQNGQVMAAIQPASGAPAVTLMGAICL